ncbi:winged helix-turn-helix transcriptional regulator [Heyndrickxia acidicola]|uniref:Helix-turn-helix domain-containing protein n=1 Tax=Heyndrickxia acidicola TaxID=209389 RepID=A0ABU6MMM5_9BACI|nr:helix-turn-helix domain-containing protein [Heyndrickxia acidicola]MED1205946.1 helix-turn-helix domain-containing protein [Heyndrickxia acidicola]
MNEEDQKNKLSIEVERSYQLISKKWICLIIHTLMESPKRFSEIHEFIPDLSKRMLNERLKEMEEWGLVIRNVIADRPVRTEYSLTRKGTELGKSLKSIEAWGEKWVGRS